MTIEATKIISSTTNIICSLFVLLLVITYYCKKRVNNSETTIYKTLLNVTLVNLLIEAVFYYLFQNGIVSIWLDIAEKGYYIANLLWMYIFTIYTISITKPFSKSRIYNWNSKIKNLGIGITVILLVILVTILPIERIYDNDVLMQSSGAAPAVMFLLAILMLAIDFFLTIFSLKKIERKKSLPLFLFLIVIVIELMLSSTGSQLLLITLSMSLVIFLMYHTIENPDVKMLEEVSMAKEQAEKANTAKSEFLSNMSHEIRTPLNAIVGFSESLKEDQLTDESREKVDDIITASNNLLEIVNGILDISKIEANKLEIINKEYEPAEMFKELISLTKARIGDKGLDFQVNIDETIPSVLYGDNARIKQIILNILTNAVKYTKEGYVTFTVSSVLKDNVCRLIISVEDSGIGIKQESISKLFSKFERLNVEKQLTIEGTGLGLAITKKLLDLMNGTIIVQSIYGQGSKFTISVDQRIISLDTPLAKQPAVSQSTIVDANGAKLLIVDDNEMNIKVAMTLLKKYHFDIDYCNSGLACLAKIRDNQKFDIILLDDMMPRMSGKETLAKLKEEKGFNTPVIALTANALTGMKEEYLNAGFNDYLSKPIEKPELERVIKEFIMKDTKENINTDTSMSTTSILEKQMKEVPTEPPKNILIIDNNVYSAKILTEILNQFNVTVTTAKTGEEAIINIIDKPFDLILLDDSLEDTKVPKMMNDFTSIAGFNSPVVLMSKQTEEEVKQVITKNNLSGYISKPINNIEVENMYASILKKD